MSGDLDTIIAATEAARILRLSPAQVHALAATDVIPIAHRTPNGDPRFYTSELEAIAARANGRTPAGAA